MTINEKGREAQTINFTERIEPHSSSALLIAPALRKVENYNVTLNMTTNKWDMENVPALRGEAFITTPLDYYDKIEFQLNSIEPFNGIAIPFSDTWEKFVKDEIKDGTTGKKLRQRGAIKDLTKSLTQDKTEPMDKIAAISNYIKTNISTQSGFFLANDRSNEDVIQKKTGTVGDINLLLGAMLSEAGFKVTPVYLSTRSHYALVGAGSDAAPLQRDLVGDYFNHAFLCVPMERDTVWLECTSSNGPAGYCGNFTGDRDVLILTEKGGQVVHTPYYSEKDNRQMRLATVKIDAEGNATTELTTLYSGLQQDVAREFAMHGNEKDVRDALIRRLHLPSFDLKSFKYIADRQRIPTV